MIRPRGWFVAGDGHIVGVTAPTAVKPAFPVCPVCAAYGHEGRGVETTEQTFVIDGMREGVCGTHFNAWLDLGEREVNQPREGSC